MNLPEFEMPAPRMATGLTHLLLAACAIAALDCRDTGHCDDCRDGQVCPDHQADLDLADQFDAAYMQVVTCTTPWCDLAVTLAAGVN